MRSRTVQPIRHKEKRTGHKKKKPQNFGDTQPMAPVREGQRAGASDSRSAGSKGIRSGYREYQKVIDRRRQVLNTPKPAPEEGTGRRSGQGNSRTKGGALRRAMGKSVAKGQYFDFDMLLVIVFLMCFGLVMLYSASAYEAQVDVQLQDDMYYFSKQALIGAAGFVVMFIVSRIDYHIYGAFAVEIYVVSMILMALVRTPLGVTLNGARRWIRLPGNLTLQPAEITKIAVILFISYELCRMGKKAYKMAGIVRILVFGAIAAGGVLFLTDNLSTAIIVMAITCILIFVIHPKTRPFLIIIGAAVAAAAILIAVLAATAANSDNFRIQRIISWLNPEATADSGSFQVLQGLYAIGSGGFFGKGLGNSTQKLGAIPEAQNDMILVVICEELGVFGAIIIFVLFGLLLYRLMFIAKNAPDLYGSLIATGIFAHIALQVVFNVAVVTGLLPTTGITLPFISYGGTAILFLMAEMGIALGISRRIKLEGEQ
ncbi:MAG TPA: putative lipid II flippase FtsW [Candidatus Mediterraneibacter norwichensis]|nr:putative lipid II flippase FtsW [Candidatus Mediterraneibacter norwichensis]